MKRPWSWPAASWLIALLGFGPIAQAEPLGGSRSEALFQLASRARLQGSVMTVNGPLAPERLGFTLMHEHLFIDWFERFSWPSEPRRISSGVIGQMRASGWPVPATPQEADLFGKRDLTLADIDLLRRGARSRSNYTIDDEALIAHETAPFQARGGRTIVDLTPIGLGRDPDRLRRFSRATGLNVVMGTGWYRWPFHPEEVRAMTVDDLTARMVSDIAGGPGAGAVRAGIVGEIPLDSRSVRLAGPAGNAEIEAASQAPRRRLLAATLADREKIPLAEIYDAEELKLLRAAARTSRLTGAALSLHGVDPWIAYLSIVQDEGADLRRTIVGHAHFLFRDPALLRLALDRGVMLEADYDLQQYPTKSPVGEFEVILDGVAWAIKNGYREQILLSHDICNKIGLQRYGGGGYVTLQNYVFPYLKARGVTDDDLVQVMVRNPARLLTLAAPQRALH